VGGSTPNAAPEAVLPTPVKAPPAEAGEIPEKENGPGSATPNSVRLGRITLSDFVTPEAFEPLQQILTPPPGHHCLPVHERRGGSDV
jgi:hypothetical protein